MLLIMYNILYNVTYIMLLLTQDILLTNYLL